MPNTPLPYIAPVLCCSVCGIELRRMAQDGKPDLYAHPDHNTCHVSLKCFEVYASNQVREVAVVYP